MDWNAANERNADDRNHIDMTFQERTLTNQATLSQMSDGPCVTVAMLGARMHYAVPRLLYEAGLLERFYTDSYIGNKPWLKTLLKAIPPTLQPRSVQRWLARKDPVLPPERVTSFEAFGWRYAWRRRRSKSSIAIRQVFAASNADFNRLVIANHPGTGAAVWGFNGACLELLEWASLRGMRCIVEQTIAPKRIEHALLSEEAARWPGWQPGLQIQAYPDALSRREEAEWMIADRIVAGSTFVADGLRACGVAADRIRVIPYGVDIKRFDHVEQRPASGKLRVLFAGEVGLRKGVPDLLYALLKLGPDKVEARFAGHVALSGKKIAQFLHVASFLGAVPRGAMRALFQWADVFVLPSLVEGSATVTYEALMSGTPVITTPNAGSIVQNGVQGFVVPIRDQEALAAALMTYTEDRRILSCHRNAILATRESAGLDRYREDLINLLYKEGLLVSRTYSLPS